MNSIDTSKRLSAKAVGAGIIFIGSGGFIKPAKAFIDPVIGGAIITGIVSSVIQGVYSFFNTKERARLDAEADIRKWHLERATFYLGSLPAAEQMALLSNRNFVNTLLSGNVDGYGTLLAVAEGRVMIERGNLKGTITADQAMVNGNIIVPTTGTVAIPTEPEQRFEGEKVIRPFIEYQASAMGISEEQYKDKFTPKTFRKFSTSKKPSASNSNLMMVTAVNNGDWINKSQNIQKSSPQIQIMQS